MKKSLILLSVLFILNNTFAQTKLPGVEVYHSSVTTGIYLGSPSIVVLPNGTYVASMDEFGAKLEAAQGDLRIVRIFASYDKGVTWKQISVVKRAFWSNLFVYEGDLYLFGTSGQYGKMVIRRSKDGGMTWTEPLDENTGVLRDDEQYHTAPVPVLIHNGRIYRAFEDRNPPEKWGVNFRAFVISAPLGSDLLKASSWTATNRIRFNPKWDRKAKPTAWLEGNVVAAPDGNVLNIMRNEINDYSAGKICILNVSKYGETLSFDPKTGFIPVSGGSTKFTIRFDSVSGKYWSLMNYVPEKFIGAKFNPGGLRNTVGLVSSTDLKNWNLERIVIQHEDYINVGFQYVDWVVDGNDIISLMRTAFPEPDGTPANNFHDSNYMMFYRVKDFRSNKY